MVVEVEPCWRTVVGDVRRLLLQRGYIVLAAGAPPAVLCLTPPLCLSDAQIDGFVAALAATMEQLA